MGKFNDQLNPLFEKWIQISEKKHEMRDDTEGQNIIFTYDGLMEKPDSSIDVEECWQKADMRIMFLVKDQPSQYRNDSRLWLKDQPTDSPYDENKKKLNRELKPKFIHNIANVFYGLSHADKEHEISFQSLNKEDVKKHFLTSPFAFVECKKQCGKTSISNSTLHHYLYDEDYKELLYQEIKILKPNMIVCTNNMIYQFVQEMYGMENLIKLNEPRHNSIRIFAEKEILILNSFHPSARISYMKFYDGVMDHYRAFLRSEFAEKNRYINK